MLDPRLRLSRVVLTGVALGRVENKEELRHLESANIKSYGAISNGRHQGSAAAVLAVGLSNRSWDSLQSSLLGSLTGSSVT